MASQEAERTWDPIPIPIKSLAYTDGLKASRRHDTHVAQPWILPLLSVTP